MHYHKFINRVDFGEVNFNKSTKDRVLWKKVCSIYFPEFGNLNNTIYFNSLNVLKDPDIFTVLETFLWSEEYKETVEELIDCLDGFGFEPLDLNTLKDDVKMEE